MPNISIRDIDQHISLSINQDTSTTPPSLVCYATYSHLDTGHTLQRGELLLSGRLTKRVELRLRVREQSSRLVELRNPTLVEEHDLYREPDG